MALRGKGRILGLFAPGAMGYAVDRNVAPTGDGGSEPSLSQMTIAALQTLSQTPEGFVLVVNQGRLDWACHDHDAGAAAHEVQALDAAVRAALDFARTHPSTLVLVVGSHETSGLAITPNFHPDVLRSARSSLARVAAAIRSDRLHYDTAVSAWLGWTDLKTEEREKILLASEPAPKTVEDTTGLDPLVVALASILDGRGGLAWATADHTGEPCPVAAQGPGADRFTGWYDNTEIPRRLAGVEHPVERLAMAIWAYCGIVDSLRQRFGRQLGERDHCARRA